MNYRTRDFIPHVKTARDMDMLSPYSKEHRDRRQLYNLYWDYYRGRHRRPIKQREGQADDNVIVNWSKKIVDAGVSFLMGQGVEFAVDEEKERNDAEQYLDDVWADDARRRFVRSAFLQSLAQNGAVTGTAVIRIYPQDGDKPILRSIDPGIVDIITDPDDVDAVSGYHLLWKSGDVWKRHRIEMEDSGLTWAIYEEEKDPQDRDFRTVDEMVWEYDFPPIFHCQNLILANDQHGISDLEDADLNDAVNFVASNTNRIVRFHAHPRTIGTGFNASALQSTAVDQFWTISSADAKVYNLEMESDLASSRAHQEALEEALHQVSSVPRLDPAKVNVGALSGFALRILYGPLIQKTQVKQLTYGGLLSQVNRALLILGGFDDQQVNNIWPDPLPISQAERATEWKMYVDGGVDPVAAAEVAGYEQAQIDAMGMNQRLNPMDEFAPPLNEELGDDA